MYIQFPAFKDVINQMMCQAHSQTHVLFLHYMDFQFAQNPIHISNNGEDSKTYIKEAQAEQAALNRLFSIFFLQVLQKSHSIIVK